MRLKNFMRNTLQLLHLSGLFGVELVEDVTNLYVRAVSRWDSEESLNRYKDSELFGEGW